MLCWYWVQIRGFHISGSAFQFCCHAELLTHRFDKAHAALDFILRTLADNGGYLTRKQLIAFGKEQGISATSIDRAGAAADEECLVIKGTEGKQTVYSMVKSAADEE